MHGGLRRGVLGCGVASFGQKGEAVLDGNRPVGIFPSLFGIVDPGMDRAPFVCMGIGRSCLAQYGVVVNGKSPLAENERGHQNEERESDQDDRTPDSNDCLRADFLRTIE